MRSFLDGMNVKLDSAMPKDEVRLETETQEVTIKNGLVGPVKPRRQAIEPTAVEKMPRSYYIGIDIGLGDSYNATFPIHKPTPCIHHRKTLLLGSTRWRCTDCGTAL